MVWEQRKHGSMVFESCFGSVCAEIDGDTGTVVVVGDDFEILFLRLERKGGKEI